MKKFICPVILAVIILFANNTVFAQPDIDGNNWSGYFRTTGYNNYQSITAVIHQSGDRVEIITSKSGLGHHLIGSINSIGHMLLYDQYDGEDWTTHYGPATSSKVAIYDYICPTCSALNVISLTRRIPPPGIPEVPATVSASKGLYKDRIVVTWSTSAGASSYQVYRCTSPDVGSCTPQSNKSASPYVDENVVANGIYYYRVKACNSGGCSGYSTYDTGYLKVAGLSLSPIYDLLLR